MPILSRREYLIALISSGLTSGGTWVALRARHPSRESHLHAEGQAASFSDAAPDDLQALNAVEYAVLVAASERIFPRDTTPGASDLGVASYVDAALARDIGPTWGDGFRDGLQRLDGDSLRRFSVPFVHMTSDEQDALLADWAAREEGARSDDARFVRSLIVATLEGALGDPVHGGNAKERGWRSLGLRADPFAPSEVRRR
jgi:hypothetical protein